MTIDKFENEKIFPLNRAKNLCERLNKENKNDQFGWRYELEILSNGKAKIKVLDFDNEFLGYI